MKSVLVISIDGMHSQDLSKWVQSNPSSTLAKLAATGVNYSNAFTTKPSDSIPSTVGIFTGGSPAIGGMYYDDAYNRAWFAPMDTTCSKSAGTVIDLKQGINAAQSMAAAALTRPKCLGSS
jgi:predicted AlkP superfamily pyrophosphatase or phosphodiesterase